jgi:hypothetical protein
MYRFARGIPPDVCHRPASLTSKKNSKALLSPSNHRHLSDLQSLIVVHLQ